VSGIGGPGPLYTAKSFVAPVVSARLSREWGEALWTASDLATSAFHAELAEAGTRWLFGLRP